MKNIHEIDEIRNVIQDWHDFYYPKMRYTKNDAQVIPSGVATKIMYDDIDYDTKSCYDVPNARFVSPFDGYYQVNGSICSDNVAWSATNIFLMALSKNGTIISYGMRDTADYGITKYSQSIISDSILLFKNDYLEINIYQNTGGNINTYTNAMLNYFSVHRI
jgi:hypothetical protein